MIFGWLSLGKQHNTFAAMFTKDYYNDIATARNNLDVMILSVRQNNQKPIFIGLLPSERYVS